MTKILRTGLAAAFLLAGTTAAHAQLSAGHILVGGNAGYNRDHTGNSDQPISSTGMISPRLGYMVADNFAVGLDAMFTATSLDKQGENADKTDKTFSTRFGAFARYYKPAGEHAAFFGQVNAYFGSDKDKPGEGDESKTKFVGASIHPGFTFFPTDHFGLEVMLGNLSFDRIRPDTTPSGQSESDVTRKVFDASLNLRSLTLGATFYLGGKQ